MSGFVIWTKRGGDSAIKINVSVTLVGNYNETRSKSLTIGELVMMQFKAKSEKTGDKININYSFSLSKHNCAKGKTIKVNIINNGIGYCATDIDTPDKWSEWQAMGCQTPFVNNSAPYHYYAVTNFIISAYEDKKDAILSKLYTDTDFTDFLLSTPEGSVAVHKAYMAAHSDVFKAMLSNEWKETGEGQINVHGATVQTLQQLKDYMYLGKLPEDGLRPLLLVARVYLIEDLEKKCIRKLAESVSAEELLSLVQFACDNNIPELACTMIELTQDCVINEREQLRHISLNTIKRKQNETDTDTDSDN